MQRLADEERALRKRGDNQWKSLWREHSLCAAEIAELSGSQGQSRRGGKQNHWYSGLSGFWRFSKDLVFTVDEQRSLKVLKKEWYNLTNTLNGPLWLCMKNKLQGQK